MNHTITENNKAQQKLIKQCLQGSKKAQLKLYHLYAQAMYNTALRILKNNELAEEAMQDAFLKAFDNLSKFSTHVSFGAWLKKIVVNQCIDYLRKPDQPKFFIEEHNTDPDWVTEHENTNEQTIEIDALKQAIEKLPEGYGIVFNLHLIDGYSFDEIAEILNIKSASVRSQYTRAKQKIAQSLKLKMPE